MSAAQGVLWFVDRDLLDGTPVPAGVDPTMTGVPGLVGVELPFGGNFDIQFIDTDRLVIGQIDASRLWELDLTSGHLEVIADDPILGSTIGVAVDTDRPGFYFVADESGNVVEYDTNTATGVVLVGRPTPGADGIAYRDGSVYFTEKTSEFFTYDLASAVLSSVTVTGPAGEGYTFNGFVFAADDSVVASSTFPTRGVVRFTLGGDFIGSLIGTDLCSRNPEDVGVFSNGVTYWVDSDFEMQFTGFEPRLCSTGTLPSGELVTTGGDTLVGGPGLGDIVDLILIAGPEFLLIDEDTVDNGIASIEDISFGSPFCGGPVGGPGDPAVCINDDIADPGVRTLLFSRTRDVTPIEGLTLPTGQVGDEGLFRFTNPDPQTSLQNGAAFTIAEFFNASGAAADQANLDKIDGVAPLDEVEIAELVGKTVCAVVYDSDISVDVAAGFGNLQGATLGVTAFRVTAADPNPAGGSYLPVITVDLLPSTEAIEVCGLLGS